MLFMLQGTTAKSLSVYLIVKTLHNPLKWGLGGAFIDLLAVIGLAGKVMQQLVRSPTSMVVGAAAQMFPN